MVFDCGGRFARFGTFRATPIQPMKHTSDREEWKRGGIVVLLQIIESGVNVTVGDHGLDNVNGSKSMAPGAMGLRDLTQ
jgi:hypothetical protein